MQFLINQTNKLVFTLIVGSIFSSGCTLQRMVRQADKNQIITVEPSPLVANGQNITFELKGQIPNSLVRDKQRYKLDVFYLYNNDEKRENLGSLNFEFGEFLFEKEKPTISKVFTFPYQPEKQNGKLMVQGLAIAKKGGETKYGKPKQVAIGLNTTPLLLVRNNDFSFIPETYTEEANKPAVLTFYFEENQAKLQNYAGSKLQTLEQYFLDNVASQTVKVSGSQSPDEAGSNMAEKRATAVAQYYRDRVNVLDYSGKKVNVSTQPTQEKADEILIRKLKATALPRKDVQEIVAILESDKSNAQKTAALKTVAAAEYLENYVYPSMRAAYIEINYNRNRKSDYELYLLARRIAEEKADADVLTEEELQYAATLTPLLNEKRKLYEAAVKTTDKWAAYYNLGTVYMEMARKEYRPKAKQELLTRAIHNLTFAGFRNPTVPVYYSLASAYHIRGEMLEALQYYDYALRLGGEPEMLQRTFADKAALEIEIGQYDDAIASLRYAGNSYQTNMNLGLSYLLKENYEGALAYYGKALELKPNDALANYSIAVLGARTNDAALLESSLRKAIKADNTFVQKAINDLEFRTYKGKPAFEDALIR